MGALVDIAKAIASDHPMTGIVILLVVLLAAAVWAFWQERKRNNRIQEERVAEAREDTELITNALNEASQAAHEVKNSNDALRLAVETLARAL